MTTFDGLVPKHLVTDPTRQLRQSMQEGYLRESGFYDDPYITRIDRTWNERGKHERTP